MTPYITGEHPFKQEGGSDRFIENINNFGDVIGNVPDYGEVNPNLFDAGHPENIPDTIYNTDTDTYAASGSRFDTHPIPVVEGEQYYISHSLNLGLPYRPRFLDASGNIVHLETGSQVCPAGWVFNVPVGLGIESLRFSTHTPTINEFEIRKVVRSKALATGNHFSGASVMAIGDSIVAQSVWLTPLTDLMQFNLVANNAVSGSQVSGGVSQLNSGQVAASDIIFIGFGTNDHNQDASLGTTSSTPASDNFVGNYMELLETIYGINPTIRVVLLTPPHNANSRNVNAASANLKDYADMTKFVGAQYSALVVDVFGESGISPENVSELTQDNTHINILGGERVASLVAKKLKSV